jgi:large subunit ribosomal protein L25
LDIIKINARLRSGTGKSYTGKARAAGWIPAIYYGHNRVAQNVEIDAVEFSTLVRTKKTGHLIDLGFKEEAGDAIAIIKEVQRDVIDRKKFLHIDFQHVNMNEVVVVKVAIELTGLPIGVKDEGGILNHMTKSINVECLPVNIPEKIFVDVTNLKVGESIHLRDITVPDAQIKDSGDEVIAVVVHAAAEEVKKGDAADTSVVADAKKDTGKAPAKDAKAPAKDAKAAGKDAK